MASVSVQVLWGVWGGFPPGLFWTIIIGLSPLYPDTHQLQATEEAANKVPVVYKNQILKAKLL